MLNLITDRTQDHVDYLEKLNRKEWVMLTPTEKAEWSGNPLFSPYLSNYDSPVNLFSGNGYGYMAFAEMDGENIVFKPNPPNLAQEYVRFSLGTAEYFIGKTVTFSFDSMSYEGDIEPLICFRWSTVSGNIAELDPLQSNSVTFECPFVDASSVAELRMFVYFVRSGNTSPDDALITLNRVMFEFGSTASEYVSYKPVLDTYARRGAYNYTDVNRVEAAVAEIGDLYGLTLTTKTDWGLWDIPTETAMARYLSNVVAIRDAALALYSMAEFPVLPDSMDNLTWETANNIESVLYLAYALKVGGTLTWDGVTTGLDAMVGTPRAYKVSDAVFNMDDIVNGASMWLYRSGTETEVEVVIESPTSGATIVYHDASGLYAISVDENGAKKYGAPSPGTYFVNTGILYVSKLVIPGYTGFLKEE